jgi:hypothetical protein
MNFAILALWGVLMAVPHGWAYRIWGRLCRVSPEQFDAISFGGLVFCKVLVVVFNLVPYVALRIAGHD